MIIPFVKEFRYYSKYVYIIHIMLTQIWPQNIKINETQRVVSGELNRNPTKVYKSFAFEL